MTTDDGISARTPEEQEEYLQSEEYQNLLRDLRREGPPYVKPPSISGRPRYTLEQYKKSKELYLQGLKTREICEKTGVHPTTLCAWMKNPNNVYERMIIREQRQ